MNTQTSNNKTKHDNKKLKRFVIISILIFGAITALSFVLFTSCNANDQCNVNYSNVFNVILLTCGIIGISYGFMILKDFNTKIDTEIMENYKEMLLDEKDKDDKKEEKKLSLF
jgi:predicted membrane channel-forming protein YqfA (hemolysin III family)